MNTAPRAKVAVLRVAPEAVVDQIERAIDLAEARPSPGARAVLATVGDEYSLPGCFTTPWQLDAVTRTFDGDALLADARAPSWLRHRAASAPRGLVEVRPRRVLRVLDALCPTGISVPEAWFGATWCALPTACCHVDFGLRGALTSGPLPVGMRSPRSRAELNAAHVDAWAIRREICPGTLVVMDATTVADGLGAFAARPVIESTILASTDPVALDAVAASIMGLEPLSVDAIALAEEEKLGVGALEDIEVLGLAPAADWGLSPRARGLDLVGEAMSTTVGFGAEPLDRIAAWLRAAAAARSPRNRALRRSWRQETDWGRLFDRMSRDAPSSR